MFFFKSHMKTQFVIKHCINKFRAFPEWRRSCNTSILLKSTKTVKDVVLYEYENPHFYKYMNLFGVCQFFTFSYLAYFTKTGFKEELGFDKLDVSNEVWYRRIKWQDERVKNGLAIFYLIFAIGGLFLTLSYSRKSVRQLVLLKGGNTLKFLTYSPFKDERIFEVPVCMVSAKFNRQAAKSHLSLKIQSKSLFYIFDMSGQFHYPELFDFTAGVQRAI